MNRTSATIECSVVVPSYRGAMRLPVLLDSLAGQDYLEPWEVIVVLDGEDQQTRAVADSYRDRLDLRIVSNAVPQGVASAMNLGISEARGRIVMRSDDDLRLPPDCLRVHMRHHATPNVGVISPTRDVFPAGNFYARAYGQASNARALVSTYARPENLAWIAWAACNSVPRSALLEVGGFNSELPYGEDSELGYRLFELGIALTTDARVEVEHLGPPLVLSTRVPRAFISGASKKAFQKLHPGALPSELTPTDMKTGVWRACVMATSAMLRTRGACAAAGALGERVLPVIPLRIATRVVALLVEAAALSGRRYGNADVAVYQGQKARDLAQEQGK